MILYQLTQKEKDCCGCGACVHACPKNCISMKDNADGFLYPIVNQKMCINCGLCSKVCPMENNEIKGVKKEDVLAYAAYTMDSDTVLNSSSGGIFAAFAKYILKKGGKVYGATLKNREVETLGIDKDKDLHKLQGSKYIQCDTKDSFILIKKDLESGKKVFYTGTPCQVSALKKFLNKEYENLYLADFICHGVPSKLMFKEYVKFLEDKHKGELIDINFRDKEKYGWSITLRYDIKKNNKVKRYYVPSKLSEYFTAFLRGYILRESCYNCPRANLERAGDITLGDYWGYQKVLPEIKNSKGLSIVLVNSPKGEEMIKLLENENCYIRKLTAKEAMVEENINLFRPTPRHEIRNLVYNELHTDGFKAISKKYFLHPKRTKEKIKSKLPLGLVEYLRKMRK